MPFNLSNAVRQLCETAKYYLEQPKFVELLTAVGSFNKDNLLFWNLQLDQGFVVIDYGAGKAYRVFDASEKLSNNHPCDPALAGLVVFDIERFVDAVNDKVSSLVMEEIIKTVYFDPLFRSPGETLH